MNVFKKTVLAATVALVLGLGANAHAMMMNGGMGYVGNYAPDSQDLTAATVLASFTNVVVNSRTADFLGILANNESLTHANVEINAGAPSVANPLWQSNVNPTSFFKLSSYVEIFNDTETIILKGTGTFNAAGFDPTAGTWNLTANWFGAGTTPAFNFSSTSVATPVPPAAVPEPRTILFMGSGLFGLGLWRKFKK